MQLRRAGREVGETFDLGSSALELASALDVLGVDGNALVLGASPARLDVRGVVIVEATVKADAVATAWARLQPVTERAFRQALRRSPAGRDLDAAALATVQRHFSVLRKVYQRPARAHAGLTITTT